MVPPNVLAYLDDYTVSIILALDTTIAVTNDHDPIFGISNMKVFMGFSTINFDKMKRYGPCPSIAGVVGTSALQGVQWWPSPYVNSTHYSSELKMYLRPSEYWGSCHTELNEGTTFVANYSNAFDPKEGLYFEFYCYAAKEEYHIKYIDIDVVQN